MSFEDNLRRLCAGPGKSKIALMQPAPDSPGPLFESGTGSNGRVIRVLAGLSLGICDLKTSSPVSEA
jgi:hypothetical protein